MPYKDEKEFHKHLQNDTEWRDFIHKANEDGMSTTRMLGTVLLIMGVSVFVFSIFVVYFYLQS